MCVGSGAAKHREDGWEGVIVVGGRVKRDM